MMVFIGLGSNLSSSFGDRFKNIDLAISFIKDNEIKLVKQSSYYETPSYPIKDNPKFINVVIQVETSLSPENLASVLLLIEKKIERIRDKKNDPRTCDIDIIDYNGQIINFKCENLFFSVPHKNLSSRNFVLYPLKEILPDWKHPKTKESINLSKISFKIYISSSNK